MPVNKRFSKKKFKKNAFKKNKTVGNYNMVHNMSYEPPCQGVVRGVVNLTQCAVPANSFPSGCESYQIDVSQGYDGGQPIVLSPADVWILKCIIFKNKA